MEATSGHLKAQNQLRIEGGHLVQHGSTMFFNYEGNARPFVASMLMQQISNSKPHKKNNKITTWDYCDFPVAPHRLHRCKKGKRPLGTHLLLKHVASNSNWRNASWGTLFQGPKLEVTCVFGRFSGQQIQCRSPKIWRNMWASLNPLVYHYFPHQIAIAGVPPIFRQTHVLQSIRLKW